ncbi:alpha/beta hydrolase [Alcanivorax hongdengensis A-11-3]|uniref:Alpha/beta hydrolase n=2 Tax=Alcanivorax hongdengensis TaxID=519051 RepID=L0WI62_9GAMM|nr:alpha/beta hydrolase [Alcanivorax hongdengensis A-11-3]
MLMLLTGCAHTPSIPPALSPTVRLWQPDTAPRGVILGLHSFGDFSAAFDLTGQALARAGYVVQSYDQAGFGDRGLHGHWAGETRLVDEACQQIHQLADHYQQPVFLLGESLGGAVAMLAARQCPQQVAGLILAAPAVREGIRFRYGWNLLIGSAAAVWPSYPLTVERDPQDPTLAPDSALRLAEDPRVMRQVRMDTYWGLIKLADSASDMAAQLRQPTLLLYGGKDESVPRAGIDHLRQHLAEHLSWHYYPQGPHLLLQSRQWQDVTDDIRQWLADQSR